MLRGGLFTRYFLEDGIREMEQYRRQDAAEVEAFAEIVRRLWAKLAQMPRPSEAETEAQFIFPMFSHLGWEYLPQQEPGRGHRDITDALLFIDPEAKARALPLHSADRFRLGSVVVENEARDTRLDRASSGHEAPSSQILRYLSRAEVQSGGSLRWGPFHGPTARHRTRLPTVTPPGSCSTCFRLWALRKTIQRSPWGSTG